MVSGTNKDAATMMESSIQGETAAVARTSSTSTSASRAALRAAHSSSTLASIVSQSRSRNNGKSSRSMSNPNPPETKFSSLKYGTSDNLGTATICDSQTGTPLKRHTDLWFEDGSVVCRAEDTVFCVHMSVLARHSDCFRDMFAIPQPAASISDTLVLEGGMRHGAQQIPVITLFDNPEDVANLLGALYDIGPYVLLATTSEQAPLDRIRKTYRKFGNNDEDDFRVVSGILRLATKYIIDELREMALAHLTVAWPTSLKAWDLREDLARNYEMEAALPGAHLYPHPFAVINLAREVDAPSLLPAAFYDLSRYSYSQIFEPHEDDPLYRPSSSGVLPSLSPADIQRLCVGKEHTQQMITCLIQAMGNGQHIRPVQQHTPHNLLRRSSFGPVCVSAAACRKDFTELVELATQHYLFDRERGCYDPLYVAEELGQLKSAEVSECKACAKSLEAWAAKEREKVWRLIPGWFRLDMPVDPLNRRNTWGIVSMKS